ncbi:MAG: sensor histidine kinase [Saprospiraceae bacterium]
MDGSIQQNEILMVITVGIIVMMTLALALVLFFYFSQKKFQNERLKAQEREIKHQEQLLFSTIVAQEKERERIAKDLHDSIGSKLNVINLGLHRVEKAGKDVPAIQETTGEIFSVISDTIVTTRRISHDLLPPTLANFGLQAALEEFCEGFRRTDSLELAFEMMQQDPRPTDKQVELGLFRTVQELVNNSIKHGKAGHIHLRLWCSPSDIRLEYLDDGKGFDMQDGKYRNGLGMQNIESRMKMIDASYQFTSAPGKGVKFRAQYNYPL